VNIERRLQRLEGIHLPAEEPFTFTIAAPPDGLTEAQQAEWREEHGAIVRRAAFLGSPWT
jgi:hypothetical protein